MIASLCVYVALTAICWAGLWPMLRYDHPLLRFAPPLPAFDVVPDSTYDSRGMA